MRFLQAFTFLSALGCGLMAGFFFAFSAAVMKTLARLPPAHGIAAMQSINVTVINPLFLAAFLGTAVTCAVAAIAALASRHERGSVYLVAGGLFYLAGTFLVTIACNVPRNNALAAVDPSSAAGATLWAGYLAGWTAWNHVRAAAALGAAALLTLGLFATRSG